MPEIDFTQYDEADDFAPVPDGQYEVEVEKVDSDRTTRDGAEMWGLRFKITKGKFQNRFIFDNMVFSENAMKRVKLICSRLGLDVSGKVNLTTDMLIGKRCVLETEIEEYEDQEGKTKKRNKVPFAGYYRIGDGNGQDKAQSQAETKAASPKTEESEPEESEEDGLPF